jgi:hypothetical protein
MVVRVSGQKFKRKGGLPPWPRARKMESHPCCDLKIMFDKDRNYSQGLKIPFIRIASFLENCDPGCAHNFRLANLGKWLLSILITLFPV